MASSELSIDKTVVAILTQSLSIVLLSKFA